MIRNRILLVTPHSQPVHAQAAVHPLSVGHAPRVGLAGRALNESAPLAWNTFMGGSGDDHGTGMAVDGSGNIYVTGNSDAIWGSPVRAFTDSSDDAFVAKLDPSGSLLWNTFLGGSGSDFGYGIAVDGSGNVYVTGYSNATWSCSPTSCTVRA